jgi:hypothetical protein
VKAISLWQPWASLIAVGVKKIETRHWHTPYKGPIAIHAAKKLEKHFGDELAELCEDEFGGHWMVDLPRGAFVATANLVACEPMLYDYFIEDSYPGRNEFICGNWQKGRFAWLLDDIRAIDPVPFRGLQGLFNASLQLPQTGQTEPKHG